MKTIDLLNYGLEGNILLTIGAITYALLLSKSHEFHLRRFFVLFIVVSSLLVGLINVDGLFFLSTSLGTSPEVISIPPLEFFANETAQDNSIDLFHIGIIIYLLGVLWLSTRFVFRLWSIRKIFQDKSINKTTHFGFYLFESNKEHATFSVFDRLLLNVNDLSESDKRQMIAHELVHINQKHTYDKLIFEILTILFWFNPAGWYLQKAQDENHEFLADSEVIRHGGTDGYQELLVRKALGVSPFPVNYFSKSDTLKRIKIMNEKPKKAGKWGLGLSLLSIGVLVCSLACTKDAIKEQEEVYTKVDEIPHPKGGMESFYGEIRNQLTYPESAKKNGEEGKVFIEFVVNAQGNFVDTKVVKGISDQLDNEALRVMQNVKAWVPGKMDGKPVNTRMILPITFKLKG